MEVGEAPLAIPFLYVIGLLATRRVVRSARRDGFGIVGEAEQSLGDDVP
jgi:hypothetical protein